MAGVLDALASYVTGMLTKMAQEEVAMLIGVSGEVDKLSIKLSDLKNFLADADRRNITDKSVQGWVEELKRAMYDVTDILDLCQLKVMEGGPSKDKGCLNPLLFYMRNPRHAHDIGVRMKALKEKFNDICTRGHSFSFVKLEAYRDRRRTHAPLISRKTDPILERLSVVGEKIEEDTRTLVDMLTKDVADTSGPIKVFAIVGVGGIGKTTLSKNVFNNDTIQHKFTKKIWLSITKEFNEVDLLRAAITAAEGNLPGTGGGSVDKALLVPALADAIKDKKFFLVLDDMWDDREWNHLLKPPFSHCAAGSRVLITTRLDIVARGVKAVPPYHHVEKLDTEDAWSLLKKQVLTTQRNEPEVDMLKDIGLQIIEKCDGLPLAIKVMGGLLCQKDKERRAWKKVLNDAIWSISQMPKELNYAIYLSYEDLSPCLKQCFLHFSLKPKKTVLHDSEYVGMWIGEGYVHGDSDKLEELGIEYYKELILRNLIEPDTSHPGQYVCNMHDVVRFFAQFMTRNEALVVQNGNFDTNKLISQRFIRLSVETKGGESDGFEWRSLQEQKSLRSIIITGNIKTQSSDSLITVSNLRTLHIESTNCAALIESVYQLKHLRYLAVKKCSDITSLPKDIHRMKFLQHISLEGCENLVELPDSIVKLLDLRFLDLDDTCVISMPRGFDALNKLRTLNGFPAHMDGDWCSLEELGPLSQLSSINIVGLHNVSAASFATKARLGEKAHLSILCLRCGNIFGNDGLIKETVSKMDHNIIEEVFNELWPPPSVELIYIQGYYGCELPRWIMSTSTTLLESLKILALDDLACCTQLPDGLCQLPCLEYLSVRHAPAIKRFGPEFVKLCNRQYGSSQSVAAFPRLHNMILHIMVEWEEWEWEDEVQAMLVLEELRITNCKLRCIPPGMAFHARSLKKLTIWSVKGLQCLENFASVVELDLYDIPFLTRVSNFPKLQKLEIDRCSKVEWLQGMNALRRLVLTVFYNQGLPLYLESVKPSHLLLDCSPKVLASMTLGKSGPEWETFCHIERIEAYADDEGIQKKWHLFYTREPYNMETNIDLKEWSSEDGDEEDVDNNKDENEEEHTGHELQEQPDEILPSGSGDEDEEDLNNNKDKSEEELERRKEV